MKYVQIKGICPSVYSKLPIINDIEELYLNIITLSAEINLIDFQLKTENKYKADFNYLFNWKEKETEEEQKKWKRKAFNALYRKVQQLEIMKATYKLYSNKF